MQAIQREVVDKTDSILLVDVGNSFAFSNRHLKFANPNRYRVHFDFGSMGCASAGVIGAALGSKKKAVAVVGDGAMLMINEINTAVRYQLPCVWVVLNDSRYGMVAQGLEALHGEDKESGFPRCDFAKIAEAMGAKGISVETETELNAALANAVCYDGPIVVDVNIDKAEQAPSGMRFASLSRQREAYRTQGLE
jgi:acetolactate synthase-1/2/3 large subunit